MKRFAIFAMLAGLCCFTLGCAGAQDTATDAVDATVEMADDAADAAGETASDAADAVEDAATDAADAVDDALGTE